MYEPVTLHTLMQGLRVNDVKWLAVGEGRVPPQESLKRRRLLETFMQWLCDDFIIPLIKVSTDECSAETRHRSTQLRLRRRSTKLCTTHMLIGSAALSPICKA